MSRPVLLTAALVLGAAFSACAKGGVGEDGGQHPMMDAGHRRDAGHDAGRRDAGHDAGRRDAGHDSGQPIADAGHDAAMPHDAGHDSGSGTTCRPNASNIAVVEIMIESRSGSGDLGEWFEVENIGSCTVDLTDMLIESPTSTGTPVTHTVSSGTVAPGEVFVFAQSGDPTENHGLPVGYVYGSGTSGVVFNNGADSLRLSFGSIEIDNIAWGSTDFRVGASRQLSSTASPATNDTLGSSSWCDATDVYSSATGGPYRGTPGAANAACP